MVRDLDAVVVGGGAVGSAVAALLATAGVRVAITDPEVGGPSATRYSGGLVRSYEPTSAARVLGVRSHQLLWGTESEERRSAGFRRTGSLTLLGPDRLAEAAAGIAELQSGGIAARLLDVGQLRTEHPGIATTGLAGAIWEPGGGYADPGSFAAMKRRTALENGAVKLPGGAVRRLVPGPSDVVVHTSTATATSSVVVLAAGAGTPALLPAALSPSGGTLRTKAIRYAFFDRAGRCVPTVSDLVTGMWGRPQLDGVFEGGFLTGRPGREWDVPPRGADELVEAHITFIREGARERWPWLEGAAALGGRMGVDLYGAHGPILGPLPGAPRVVVAAGWSGAGFKTAPAAAERAANAALAALGSSAPGGP